MKIDGVIVVILFSIAMGIIAGVFKLGQIYGSLSNIEQHFKKCVEYKS